MVKGTSKQAVILHPGDKSGFEQAIFILSPGQGGEKVGSPEELLRLADRIAGQYTVETVPPLRQRHLLPCVLSFLLGTAAAALVFWLL